MRDKHSEPEQGEAASEGTRKAPQTDHLGYARLLGQVDLFMGLERVTDWPGRAAGSAWRKMIECDG
jgi:hypothetical protein